MKNKILFNERNTTIELSHVNGGTYVIRIIISAAGLWLTFYFNDYKIHEDGASSWLHLTQYGDCERTKVNDFFEISLDAEICKLLKQTIDSKELEQE